MKELILEIELLFSQGLIQRSASDMPRQRLHIREDGYRGYESIPLIIQRFVLLVPLDYQSHLPVCQHLYGLIVEGFQ
ncbi:hypothetical protein BMMGA3_11540 [Bacillus methanolicus MGA3]|uniref:Uncharacterized protein n=1 Tax=Bacillus methanolicus (strain MGA3 / ATCC 53907) TaxID=796606 RepID=A0A068LSK4_BACMM|nr:hypothetical protein BMMGA3_11540 [Bacillus methanolicus MGA3]